MKELETGLGREISDRRKDMDIKLSNLKFELLK